MTTKCSLRQLKFYEWEVCPGPGQCLGLVDQCSRRLMDVYITVCPVYGVAGQGVKPAWLVWGHDSTW